jgi:hypothetical protein
MLVERHGDVEALSLLDRLIFACSLLVARRFFLPLDDLLVQLRASRVANAAQHRVLFDSLTQEVRRRQALRLGVADVPVP